MSELMEKLSLPEKEELAELEEVIEKNLKTFFDVGVALTKIRDNRFYRESHGTFEDYCKDRWGMRKEYANKLIGASKVVTNLNPIGFTPSTESQARPLTKLNPADQQTAWTKAVETAL